MVGPVLMGSPKGLSLLKDGSRMFCDWLPCGDMYYSKTYNLI